MTTVFNLLTGEAVYFTLNPEEAVIAAYAQSHKDFNTWNYQKYRSLVQRGTFYIFCGHFAAKQGEDNGPKEDHS